MTKALRTAKVRAGRRGEFECRAVTYNVLDSYRTVFAPGCFDESLNRRLPVVCLGHSWLHVAGRATSWTDTAQGPVLTCRLDIGPDVPLANQLAAQLESRTLTDVSVGFDAAVKRAPTAAEQQRWPGVDEIITKAEMLELSVVVAGAVPQAEVLAVRSRSIEREDVRLGRMLAAGTITAAQYAAWREVELEADRALALIGEMHNRQLRATFEDDRVPAGQREEAARMSVELQRAMTKRLRR